MRILDKETQGSLTTARTIEKVWPSLIRASVAI